MSNPKYVPKDYCHPIEDFGERRSEPFFHFNPDAAGNQRHIAAASSLQHHRCAAIRAAIGQARTTQKSVAERIGMSESHFSELMTGAAPMTFEHEAAVLTVLKLRAVNKISELQLSCNQATLRVVPRAPAGSLGMVRRDPPRSVEAFRTSGLEPELTDAVLRSLDAYGAYFDSVETRIIEVPTIDTLTIDCHLHDTCLMIAWRVGSGWTPNQPLPTPTTGDINGLTVVRSTPIPAPRPIPDRRPVPEHRQPRRRRTYTNQPLPFG